MYSLKLYNDSKHIHDVAHWFWYRKGNSITVWFRFFGYGLYFTTSWAGRWKFRILKPERPQRVTITSGKPKKGDVFFEPKSGERLRVTDVSGIGIKLKRVKEDASPN